MVTITTRLILMALLYWWLIKEHEFKQNQRALEEGRLGFMNSVEVVEEYSYVRQDEFPTS